MGSRVIKDTIKTSRNVNALSDFQFRVWIHLILSADDYGRGSADPELVKNLAFPRRKGITEKQLDDALHVLANIGMINLYFVDGEPFFYFPKWSEHQRVRTKVSRFPEPDAENAVAADCGRLRQIAADCGELPQIAADCGLNPEYRIQNTESRIQKKKEKKAPPTREEVREYARSRESSVDPDRFYDFYTADPERAWIDSNGKPVNNWKQKFITWEGRETDAGRGNPRGAEDSAAAGAEKWGNLYS